MHAIPGYDYIFRAGHHPVVLYDRAAVICDINETGARNLGLPRAQCIGRSLGEFIPESQEMTVLRIAEVLASQSAALFEDCIVLGRDSRWFLSVMEPLADEAGGAPELVICTSYEITDRKRAERLLEASSQQLRLASETARLGIWHLDLESGILDWNDQMFEIYGVSREEFTANQLIGMERIHPEDKPSSDLAFAALYRGEPQAMEFRVVRPDGTVRNLYGRGAVVRDSGAGWCSCMEFRLISQRSNAKSRILQSRRRFFAPYLRTAHTESLYWMTVEIVFRPIQLLQQSSDTAVSNCST